MEILPDSIRVAAVDLNGQFRGKRLPADMMGKEVRLPLSVLNVDITGADIDGSPLVFESGDQDGVLQPTGRGPVPLPWLDQAAALIPCTLAHDDGTPFAGDPRGALTDVLDRYADMGLQVVAACELEFFLLEQDGNLAAPLNPKTGRRLKGAEILSLRELDGFEAFFNDVTEGAKAMGIAAPILTVEAGLGQFEATLGHRSAIDAADDVVLMKELIKGMARKHGFCATFMAKPFGNEAGNGLHTHFSVLNAAGENIFCDDTKLRSAVGGCLDAFQASTLFFAPHANSYDRFVENAHAPTGATWGYENRTVALRIPGGPAAATRIEHRVAGGDVNPYLLFAAMFGAALNGMQDGLTPPDPTDGSAYAQPSPAAGLHKTWADAIAALEDPKLARIFNVDMLQNLKATKLQELRLTAEMSHQEIITTYLETV